MAREYKCVYCGDKYTDDDLWRQRGQNQPYKLIKVRRGKYNFICPSCYDDFCAVDWEKQYEMLSKIGGKT